jgi:hypothetical protein
LEEGRYAILIDRHDMRDMAAERVAAPHRKDVEILDKYGVKYMTHWYDPARATGFCLVAACVQPTAANRTK